MKNDIFTTTEESLSIEIVAGKINSSRFKNITKKGIRLFDKNKIYTNSFVGEISNDELLKMAIDSKNKAGVGIPFTHDLPTNPQLKIEDKESMNAPLSSINEAIEITLDKLSKFSNQFVFNGKFQRGIFSQQIINSDGMLVEKKYATNEWYYLYKKIGSPQLFDGYIEEDGRDLDINNALERNIPYLEAYNHEIKFTEGKYPVLFINSSELLEKLSESFFADKYCEGSALYSGKLDKLIFSSAFSLFDVNYSPAHGIYKKFDGEGTIRKESQLPLIEKGVMKNIIADLRTAKKYGVKPTGNGQRSFDSAVNTNFNGLVIGAGTRSTQDILNSLENCIVVFMGHGGDFTDKGDFATPLHLSYLLKKGEIVGRLPPLTVKTSTDSMFGSRLIEIASDGFLKNNLQPSIFSEMDVYLN